MALYSFLPHKASNTIVLLRLDSKLRSYADSPLVNVDVRTLIQELRFIFPALPVLTMAAAVGLDSILPPEPVKSVAHQPNALKDNQGTKAAAVRSSLLFPLNLLLESGDKSSSSSSSSSSSISSTETAPVVGGGGEVPGGAELAAKQPAGAQQAQSIGGKRVQLSIVASRVRAVNTVIRFSSVLLLCLLEW